MRLNGLDLNLLISLDALLEERNVTKAAERVCLTQSAMSLTLKRLREYFRDELLVRVGKAMVPTSLALSLIQPVRDVLIQIQSIGPSVVEFDPASSNRTITIVASDYAMDVLLKRLIPRVSQLAPGIQLKFPALGSAYQEEFANGSIDLLVISERFTLKNHPSEVLFSDKFTCVVWSKNNIVGDKISFEQYKQMRHVCVDLGDWRIPTSEEWFLMRYGDIRKKSIVVSSFGLAIQLVSQTQWIATCQMLHARMYAKYHSLKLIETPFDIPPINVRIQWNKCMDGDPALKWIRSQLKEIAAKM